MKTWILAETLLKPSEETLFLQELVLGGQFEMLEAIERYTKHRALNYVDQRLLNFMNHNKRVVNEFRCGINIYLLSNYKYPKKMNGLNILYKNKFPYSKEKYNYLNGVSPFSKGIYRVYKNKIYKLMERL